MIDATMDLTGINVQLDRLAAAAKTAARKAAQAGAQVYYDEVRARAPVSEKEHLFYGSSAKKAPKGQKKQHAYLFKPGTLRDSIYQVYSKKLSTDAKSVYAVAWNHKKAPYGYMVEFGRNGEFAHPFLRPAFDAAEGRAVSAANAVLAAEIKKATK